MSFKELQRVSIQMYHQAYVTRFYCILHFLQLRTNNDSFAYKSEQYWGYCSNICNGETPSPDSPYNLANGIDSQFSEAWSEQLYDLRKFEPGYCITYDPPSMSKGGVSNGLYFLLGQKNFFQDYDSSTKYSKYSKYMMYSFEVYLHEKVKYLIYLTQKRKNIPNIC